jgi:hypothetical protein
MPVQGVTGSEGVRTEQMRVERRSDDVRVAEQRRENATGREAEQTRQITESGRGESVDMTA